MNSTEVCVDTVGSTSLNLLQAASLTTAVEHAAEILRSLTENELQKRYELGSLVRSAMDHAEYGDRALAAFSEKLDLDEDTLRAYAMVTRIWDPEEFQEQTERRGDKKPRYRLSWSHFVLLSGVKDARSRDELITASLAEGLSEKALRARWSGASHPSKSRPPVATSVTQLDVVGAVRELAEAGKRLTCAIDDHVVEMANRSQLMEAQDALNQLELLLVQAREQIARALAEDATTESPQLKQVLEPVQGAPIPALQAPIPFNPAPETISQAVSEWVQAPVALEAPIPYFAPRVTSQKSEPQR